MIRRTSCVAAIVAGVSLLMACGDTAPAGDAPPTTPSPPVTTGESLLTASWIPTPSSTLRVTDTEVTVLGREQLRVFDNSSGALRWQGPPGVVSQDGSTAVSVSVADGARRAVIADARNGAVRTTVPLPDNAMVAAVSPRGDTLAVIAAPMIDAATQLPSGRDTTTIDIISTVPGAKTKSLTLPANVVPEAFARSGNYLYVLDYLPASHPDHYKVRTLDIASGRMDDLLTRDKEPLDDQMQGIGGTQVASANGEWLFTLYREFGTDGDAFIHALNLGGYADCIDLPAGQGFGAGTVLAATKDGATIYALSAQGMLVEISNSALSIKASRDVGVRNATALAVRGGSVAAGSHDKVTVFSRAGLATAASWATYTPVYGLELGGDDRTIVVSDGHTADVLDVATGTPIRHFDE